MLISLTNRQTNGGHVNEIGGGSKRRREGETGREGKRQPGSETVKEDRGVEIRIS